MKSRPRGARWVALFLLLGVGLVSLGWGAGDAAAVNGEWGVVRQAYLYDDCIYAVFVSNQLDTKITSVGLRAQFLDGRGASLGTYNLTGDVEIEPYETDVVGWRIDAICKTVEEARILKSVAGF